MKVTFIPIVFGTLGTVTEGIKKGTGGFGNKQVSGDEIDLNIEKSPGDLRRLAVTQNSVKDYQC